MGSKLDVLRMYYGPLQIVESVYHDTPKTVIYAWVGLGGNKPTEVIVIPQLRNVTEMITDKYMLRVRTHVGLTEGMPVLRTAYIYRRGPDLVLGSLYYTDRYGTGLQVYECIRLLHTFPTRSEYILLLLPYRGVSPTTYRGPTLPRLYYP